ncbi:hypothetical protein M405DRAFT_830335, partial [Rhizopogon salebrosus TDB-379]
VHTITRLLAFESPRSPRYFELLLDMTGAVLISQCHFHVSLLVILSKSCLARISSVSAPFPSIPDALESPCSPYH